jgi:TolB-like protein/DNA-binding winged helix-turn-helix (wHTH) protein
LTTEPNPRSGIRIGDWELEPQTGELRKPGLSLQLQEQPLQILQALLERPGEVVTRDQLHKRIWPVDTFVDFDHGLYSAIKRLRDALGDSTENPVYIQTLSRRGYRLIAPVKVVSGELAAEGPVAPEVPKPETRTGARLVSPLATISAAAILLLVVLAAINAGTLRRRFLGASAAKPISSLAVLPLQNLSNDPAQDYFTDGMTDELITELAQVSSLRVISRTSAMYYKNTKKTLPEIARELNVDAVLEGSVLRAGDRVRITAQLVQADSDRHLWAQSYERDLRDVLVLQDDIARGIVGEVRMKLQPRELRWVNPEAYEAYLRGRHDLNNAISEADLKRSISDFETAIAKDPQSALGYSGLAVSYTALSDYYRPPREVMPRAKQAAVRALELDETLSEAHDALGWVELNYEWNWPLAEQHLKRAIELNPGNALAHDHYAWFLTSFLRTAEGFAESQRARQLDPFSLSILANSSFYSYMGRKYDRAIEQGQHALEFDRNCFDCRTYVALAQVQQRQLKDALLEIAPVKLPDANPIDLATTGSVLAAAGERLQAQELLRDVQRIMKRRFVCPYEIATTYVALGDRDEAFKWLQKAYEEHSICMVWLNADPRLDPLRSDPRFIALVRQVGF